MGGCIRRLEEGVASTGEIVGAMRKAVQNVELIGEIIHRMKNFVRGGELYYEKVAINELVQEAASLIHQEIYQRRITIRFELTDTLPLVIIDKIQIEQVLLNLIRNSIEAMLEIQRTDAPVIIKTHLVNAYTLAV